MTFAKILNDYEEEIIAAEDIAKAALVAFSEAVCMAKAGDIVAQAKLMNDAQAYVRALAEIGKQ